MVHIVNICTRKVTINNVYNNNFGGFFTYLKLYFQLWSMLISNSIFSTGQKIKAGLIILIKTPYYLIIKPFGWFFCISRRFKGSYTTVNNDITSCNVKKSVCLKFLFIPIFFYKKKANYDEINKINNK